MGGVEGGEGWKVGKRARGRMRGRMKDGRRGGREEEGGRKDRTLIVYKSGSKQSYKDMQRKGSQLLACAANYPITADAF